MQKYFRNYYETVRQYDITSEDTWNMDETGFPVGCGRTHLLVTLLPNKKILMTDPDNGDFSTSVESNNGNGGHIPSLLILKGVNILHKWALENHSDDDIILPTSETGYSNDVLAYEWIKHFDKYSKKSQKGVHRMLIVDRYGYHFTYLLWHYAKEAGIILFKLPPHSTHITQPLDAGIFQLMKHYHSEVVGNAIRLGDVDFNRLDFLAASNQFHSLAFKPFNIKSNLENTSLIPYNPEIVLEKIRPPPPSEEFFDSSPSSIPPANSALLNTPTKPKNLIGVGEAISKRLDNDESITPKRLQRFIKGSLASANLLELGHRNIEAMHQANITKKARKNKLERLLRPVGSSPSKM